MGSTPAQCGVSSVYAPQIFKHVLVKKVCTIQFNMAKKTQIQLIIYKKAMRCCQCVDLTALTNFNVFLCCKFILKI